MSRVAYEQTLRCELTLLLRKGLPGTGVLVGPVGLVVGEVGWVGLVGLVGCPGVVVGLVGGGGTAVLGLVVV